MSRRTAFAGAAPAIALALTLAGCATTQLRTPAPAALSPAARETAMAMQATREAALTQHPDWRLVGRIALTNDGHGGSGRLEWQQHGADFSVELGAPVTRRGWRLSGRAGDVVLEGLDGGPRHGADATALLREATGWEIPVAALASWVRGARAEGVPGESMPVGSMPVESMPAELEFSADGRLVRMRQDGWYLEYADWRPQPDGIELPMRVTASRDAARVRLVVDTWGGAAP